jgi:hypothetical protein
MDQSSGGRGVSVRTAARNESLCGCDVEEVRCRVACSGRNERRTPHCAPAPYRTGWGRVGRCRSRSSPDRMTDCFLPVRQRGEIDMTSARPTARPRLKLSPPRRHAIVGPHCGLCRRIELGASAKSSARNVLQRLSKRPRPHQSDCEDDQHHRAGDENEHASHAEVLQHERNDERAEHRGCTTP